jgi:CBS domain-containing protein
MGVFGGLLGALFCSVNYFMGKWRKNNLKTNLHKYLETMFYVSLTAVLMYWAPMIVKDECVDIPELPKDHTDPNYENILSLQSKFQPYLCPAGTYSPLATALFNPLGSVFKVLMSDIFTISYASLGIYLIIWYPMTIFCYGTNVPAGLFVSGILIGCGYGRLFALFVKEYIDSEVLPSAYAVVGAAAILSGYARHTFSLAIIMMESTNTINLFIPITFAVMIAYLVGGIFTRSIYINSVRTKNIPFLIEHVPENSSYYLAEDIMTKAVVTLNFRTDVAEIAKALRENTFNGFPVVNSFRKLLGIINRDYLHVLLKNQCFVNERKNRETVNHNSARLSLNSSDNRAGSMRMIRLTMSKEERRKLIQSAIDVG